MEKCERNVQFASAIHLGAETLTVLIEKDLVPPY